MDLEICFEFWFGVWVGNMKLRFAQVDCVHNWYCVMDVMVLVVSICFIQEFLGFGFIGPYRIAFVKGVIMRILILTLVGGYL